jgi:uncharacterized protein
MRARGAHPGATHDAPPLARRIAEQDWRCIERELDARGHAVLPELLCADECEALTALYGVERRFRSRVDMVRHGFGRGEYKYFRYPLPDPVQELRALLYPPLAGIANRWHEMTGTEIRFPGTLESCLASCHAAGQVQPTPLLLRYGEEDFNCLHQDRYGEYVFPLQVTVLLSRPGVDFTGGAFVLTEQRPRMQSRVEVIPLEQGDAVAFAANQRPVNGSRGPYRVKVRHGVSRVRSGRRFAFGLIFHDAL